MSGDNAVILERLNNLIESNREDHFRIEESLKKSIDDHELRLKKIEDWRIGFVAKFSVYSAIALFFGSAISTLILSILRNTLNF